MEGLLPKKWIALRIVDEQESIEGLKDGGRSEYMIMYWMNVVSVYEKPGRRMHKEIKWVFFKKNKTVGVCRKLWSWN